MSALAATERRGLDYGTPDSGLVTHVIGDDRVYTVKGLPELRSREARQRTSAPTVDELLDELYALLRLNDLDVDDDEMDYEPWRSDALHEVETVAAIAATDDVLSEDLVFLAALSPDDRAAVTTEMRTLLSDRQTSEAVWSSFLYSASEKAFAGMTYQEPPELPNFPDEDPTVPPGYFTLDDLGISFGGGALGGPPPLANTEP